VVIEICGVAGLKNTTTMSDKTIALISNAARAIYFKVEEFWIKGNELALRIRTDEPDTADWDSDPGVGIADGHLQPKHSDGLSYQSPDYWCLYKVARMLKPEPDDVFYDIGCGMGRVLCVLARTNIRKCVGIELRKDLCALARLNALHMRGRKAEIGIICADASVADLSEGTLYFMYNPFGVETLRDVLENIRKSLSLNPRNIKIVYYNSIHEPLFQSCKWLEQFDSFHTFTRRRVTFWRNPPR
jgi:precorrin-6B methylase 2